jgi:hypothetical protein
LQFAAFYAIIKLVFLEVHSIVSALYDIDSGHSGSDYQTFYVKSADGIPSGNNVSLFRAIGESEFYSVMKTKRFGFWPRSAKVKYFANEFEETVEFANKAFATDIVAVLEIVVHKDILERIGDFTNVDTTLFRMGTVEIHPEHLDEFNSSIIEIIHRY